MKIISKYKDFYDYLMGIRGVDPKVILDRREGVVHKPIDLQPIAFEKKYRVIKIAICGMLYVGVRAKGGRYYWGKDLLKLGRVEKKWFSDKDMLHIKDTDIYLPLENESVDFNDNLNCPILFISGGGNKEFRKGRWIRPSIVYVKYPKLEVYGVQKWYSPESLYTDLSNWISSRNEEVVVDNRTDKEKIQNAGFDKKTSFRNM